MLKSLLAILPFMRQKTTILLNLSAKTVKRASKILAKDPLICFGAFSFIFFVGVLLFSPSISSKIEPSFNFSALNADAASNVSQNSVFAQPANNISQNTPEISYLQQNTIVGVSSPSTFSPQVLGALTGESVGASQDGKSVLEYQVDPGDTVASIAQNFNISQNTILWANDLSSSSALKVGQTLVILPVSGVLYQVKSGDTLGAIAQTYKGDIDEIIDQNDLSSQNDIYVGDMLVIPDGVMPAKPKTSNFIAETIPVGSSYFILPLSSARLTQGLHYYNAVDLATSCGNPIYAAASGVVQRAKTGWNGGGGNNITILHPNGVVTYYGHVSAFLVKAGDTVSQGQIIALVGGGKGMAGAGNSTGCHVHFEVIGAKNPFGAYPVGSNISQ